MLYHTDMPKKEKCTKRVVFYLTPSEFKLGEHARKKFPSFRSINAYAASAFLIMADKDTKEAK